MGTLGSFRGSSRGPVVVEIGGFEVSVHRKNIRRLSLGVHPPDGRVTVSSPLRMAERTIVRFVTDNVAWIEQHRARIIEEERRAAATRRPDPEARSGEIWWRFGQALRLEVVETAGRPTVSVRPERRLELVTRPAAAADARLAQLERWRRQQLRVAAERSMAHWAPKMHVEPQFLGIRRMRTRWGTCVPQVGRIWLNLELVRRPPAELEYVVVHELAHLREGSHGRRFAAIMDRHLPDWRERKASLDRPWPVDG